VKHKLLLVLLVILAMALSTAGPVLGQTADPALARRPPDDVTDPLRCSPSISTRRR
jgi:hypothetical protein